MADCSLFQLSGAAEYTNCISAGGKDFPSECPGHGTKQSDSEAPGMLWGIWSTPSLPSLPGPLWFRVVAPNKSSIYGSNRTKLYLC